LDLTGDENVYFTSDYFSKIYDYAVKLIKMNKAYVDSLNRRRNKRISVELLHKLENVAVFMHSVLVEENLDLT
jgi:glutaminyl-tRNA synthetase